MMSEFAANNGNEIVVFAVNFLVGQKMVTKQNFAVEFVLAKTMGRLAQIAVN